MRRLTLLLIVVGLLLGAALGAQRRRALKPAPASPEDVARAAILQADRDFAKTGAAKNLDAFLRFIAEDGHAFPDGEMSTGKPAFRELWAPLFKDPNVSISWAPMVAEASQSGDMGYTTGMYEIRNAGAEGANKLRRGSYVTIWTKQPDGSWKVSLDMGTPIVPPTPPAKPTPQPEKPAAPPEAK
jgi:ketosteroid isomerase-like protein